jgi:1-acyl-sn-glycerol-3-phosphate acyltransferase
MTTQSPPIRAFNAADVKRTQRLLKATFGPWAWLTDPVVEGIENLPRKGPALYVGNHTLLGVLDAPVMLAEIARHRGIALRSLGDRAHFKVPGWRDFMKGMGCVEGTRENCTQLMQLGEQILVFPGGGGEVFKRKGEQYQLRWKERAGFARMAIENRCPIIPFAAVGGDDFYSIVLGSDEIMATRLGKLLVKFGVREEALGVYRGVGLSMIPRPERLYFKFGKPIRTTRYKGDGKTLANSEALRDKLKAVVETMIAELLEKRKRDPRRDLGRRLIAKLFKGGR